MGFCIISIAKTASKKIGALIRSMQFLSLEVALYFCKSAIRFCMEYCCHVLAGALVCYLEMLDKLQKRACHRSVASLSLFYSNSLVDVQLNWLNCFQGSLPIEFLTYDLSLKLTDTFYLLVLSSFIFFFFFLYLHV